MKNFAVFIVLCFSMSFGSISVFSQSPPTNGNETLTLNEDVPVSGFNVLANNTDPDGDPLSVFPNSSSSAGGLVTAGGPTISYTPPINFYGLDTVLYNVCDNSPSGFCTADTIFITVTPVNDPPVAVNDLISSTEDIQLVFDPLNNDYDITPEPISGLQNSSLGIFLGPYHGTATTDPVLGLITYNPEPNFCGLDSIRYRICDVSSPNLCATAWIYITVACVNDPPFAVSDTFVILEDIPAVVSPLANDNDPGEPGSGLDRSTLSIVTGSVNGTSSVNPITGEIKYTPNVNFCGVDSAIYSICDSGTPSLCATGTIIFNISCINDAPVVVTDYPSTFEDFSVTFNPLDNDYDPLDPGSGINPNTVGFLTNPLNGTYVVLGTNGEIVYTPNPGWCGIDSMEYSVCDSGAQVLCDGGMIFIEVICVNDQPISSNDLFTINEDTPGTLDVLANDFDPLEPGSGYDPTTVGILTPPTSGSIIILPTGELVYSPDTNYCGTDQFQYIACDSGVPVLCDSAYVNMVINCINDAPVSSQDDINTDEDTPISFNPLSNDNDAADVGANVDPTTLDVLSGPNHGTVSIDSVTGEITYSPNQDYYGPDTLSYAVCDTGSPVLCDSNIVVFTVTPVNDTPVIVDDVLSAPEDVPTILDVLANDYDIIDPNSGINPSSILVVVPPLFGNAVEDSSGHIVYTSDPNYCGPDSFAYSVCDSGNPILCDTGWIDLTVICVNDGPIVVNDSLNALENTTTILTPLDNDTDPLDLGGDIDPSSVSIVTGPVHGTIVLDSVTGEIHYSGDLDYCGPDSIQYVACDNGTPQLCDDAWIYIDVLCANDAPTSMNDYVAVEEDAFIVFDPLVNDFDNTGQQTNIDPTTVLILQNPANGSISVDPSTGEVTYVPVLDYCGNDTAFYSVCDDGVPVLCDTAMIVILVHCINVPTEANDDLADINNTDSLVNITVLFNDFDPEGDSLYVGGIHCSPQYGNVTVAADGSLNYILTDPSFIGIDSFCYSACDVGIPPSCDTAWVYVNILNPNSSPIAENDTIITEPGSDIVIDVTDNDLDPDGDNLVVVDLPCLPSNGVVGIIPPNSVIYQPNTNFEGLDTFCYVVCDDQIIEMCDTAWVFMNVLNPNSAPIAVNDEVATVGNNTLVIPVTANDSDPDGDSISVNSILCQPENGLAAVMSGGEVTYDPMDGYAGMDSFCYEVCDDYIVSACDTAWVMVDVINLHIPSAFSPNGDNVNDNWFITGIHLYPENNVKIFNRWGNSVYKADGYTNSWGGENMNGKLLPEATYYYLVDLGDGTPVISGYVYIHQ